VIGRERHHGSTLTPEREDEMKIWLLSQDVQTGYDTYDSAVVVAETEDAARKTEVGSFGEHYSTWAAPEHIKCELLGEAKEGTVEGLILASFNAG